LFSAAGFTVTLGLLARFTALPPPELDAAVKVAVPAAVGAVTRCPVIP